MIELVETTTADGVRLHGALFVPEMQPQTNLPPRAVLILHGAGGNFYGSTLFAGLISAINRLGTAALSVNTRGHDAVSTAVTPSGVRMYGAAYEVVDDCRHDVAAWLEWLRRRGYRWLTLMGHSLGAIKAIYSQAQAADNDVRAAIAISPPRLSHSHFAASSAAGEFLPEFGEAARLVEEGRGDTLMSVRFPIPYLVAAAGYVDKYGPAERYHIVRHARQVTCPMLFTFGTIELRRGVAFEGLSDELNELAGQGSDLTVAVIAGADHFYTAARGELIGQVESWLRRRLRVDD